MFFLHIHIFERRYKLLHSADNGVPSKVTALDTAEFDKGISQRRRNKVKKRAD